MQCCIRTCKSNAESAKKKLDDAEITEDSSFETKVDAYIRFYLHEDTGKMTDDEFVKAWTQLKFVLKETGQWKE
jgi:hypothetical protein